MTAPNANVDVGDLQQKLISLALQTGKFTSLAGHEAVNPPPNGLTGALWLQNIGPDPKRSGQAETAARVEFLLRIYIPTSGTTPEQLDQIDPDIASATVLVIGAISADFTLGGEVFAADLQGMGRTSVSGKAGWARVGEQLVRVMDITIPLIVDAVWSQSP